MQTYCSFLLYRLCIQVSKTKEKVIFSTTLKSQGVHFTQQTSEYLFRIWISCFTAQCNLWQCIGKSDKYKKLHLNWPLRNMLQQKQQPNVEINPTVWYGFINFLLSIIYHQFQDLPEFLSTQQLRSRSWLLFIITICRKTFHQKSFIIFHTFFKLHLFILCKINN